MNNERMHRITRTIGKEFCTLDVELRESTDGFKTLSVCGLYGEVLSPSAARKQALLHWESYFDEAPDFLEEMNDRLCTNFKSSRSAARHVLSVDGEYYGLDVLMERDGKVYVTQSCGHIREELLRFFPEVEGVLKWHLNNMHAGCEHQDALGWGPNKDVTVTDKVYKGSLGAPCPTCGYEYGSAWKRRELPPEVLDWFEALTEVDGEVQKVLPSGRYRGCQSLFTRFPPLDD